MKFHPFSAVAKVVTGKTPSTFNNAFYGGSIPFVTPPELDRANPILVTKTQLTEEGANSVTRIPKDSVMVSCIGSLGKIGIAGVELCTNQQINSLVFNTEIVVPRYGYHFCKTLKQNLDVIAPSTTLPIINKSRFSKIEIPLPSLPEQRRIAAILDKADALRAKRREAIAKLDQLLQVVFLDMFGDPVANPKGWNSGKIGDLLESVKYGSSEKADLTGTIPMLRMNNITYSGEMDLSNLKYVSPDGSTEEKYLVSPGDLLFNRTNSKELVGKTAVYEGPVPMSYAGYLVRGRTKLGNAPEYISAYLNSSFGKEKLRAMCKSIIGMANINAKEFAGISIPIPPVELQRKFQERVQAFRGQKAGLVAQATKIESLFASLQQRAFNGSL